jgi:4-hydroxythreonine-4-phosphate dehydrogenase
MKSEAFPPQFKIKNSKLKIRRPDRPPLILITMGDPAGIGAEVALKALRVLGRRSPARFCLLGDRRRWEALDRRFHLGVPLREVERAAEARDLRNQVGVLDLGGPSGAKWGRISPACGAAALKYVVEGAKRALAGEADALVTAPLCKESIHKAGSKFPGHTELLAHLSGIDRFAMMMVGGPFRIVLLSIHVSLRTSLQSVRKDRVWEKLCLTREALRDRFGVPSPRIAVAGVNPHAGEGGAFGREELEVLAPLVGRARKRGWRVSGPHPPDTLFHWAAKGRYDAVLCMYHDQGLIPLKLAAFEKGVNLTLGLPFVRTSPDHGTAFDIAGKGKADPSSMVEAIRLAAALAPRARGPKA